VNLILAPDGREFGRRTRFIGWKLSVGELKLRYSAEAAIEAKSIEESFTDQNADPALAYDTFAVIDIFLCALTAAGNGESMLMIGSSKSTTVINIDTEDTLVSLVIVRLTKFVLLILPGPAYKVNTRWSLGHSMARLQLDFI